MSNLPPDAFAIAALMFAAAALSLLLLLQIRNRQVLTAEIQQSKRQMSELGAHLRRLEAKLENVESELSAGPLLPEAVGLLEARIEQLQSELDLHLKAETTRRRSTLSKMLTGLKSIQGVTGADNPSRITPDKEVVPNPGAAGQQF